MALDYKAKYLELKARMLENTDMSYRLGYEQGFKDCQSQAQEQAIGQIAQQNSQPQNGQVGPDGQPQNAQVPNIQNQDQDMQGEGQEVQPEGELDQHINELEQLVAKGEKPTLLTIRDTVTKLSELRKSQVNKIKDKNNKLESAQKKLINKVLSKWDSEKSTDLDIDKLLEDNGIKIDENGVNIKND
jgi:hypothetical protein